MTSLDGPKWTVYGKENRMVEHEYKVDGPLWPGLQDEKWTSDSDFWWPKSRIKFLGEISGYFRLSRHFREIDFWWPLVVTRGILRKFQNITSGLEFHKLWNGDNLNFWFENLLTSSQWILLITSRWGRICRTNLSMNMDVPSIESEWSKTLQSVQCTLTR